MTKVINGKECELVEGQWIEVSKAAGRRAFFASCREQNAIREAEQEQAIMERSARTGETPDEIRRELRTEAQISMENAGFGIRHRAR